MHTWKDFSVEHFSLATNALKYSLKYKHLYMFRIACRNYMASIRYLYYRMEFSVMCSILSIVLIIISIIL